jgi:hypothetical protein
MAITTSDSPHRKQAVIKLTGDPENEKAFLTKRKICCKLCNHSIIWLIIYLANNIYSQISNIDGDLLSHVPTLYHTYDSNIYHK